MKEVLRNIRLLVSLIIPYLIWFIPRSSKIWVYGGRNGTFVDNTKYWFLWTNEHEPSIKHIWISNDSETIALLRKNNYKAYKPFSLVGLYFVLRAKIVFFSHGATSIIRPIFLKTAIKFDFFHGIPLKTMGTEATKVFAKQSGPYFKYNLSKKLYSYYQKKYVYSDYLVIPSKLFTKMFTDFSGKRLYVGYPRNIVFQLNNNELKKIIYLSKEDIKFQEEISRYSLRYIYMPTFREGKPDFINEAFDSLGNLNDLMVKKNAVFLLKLHPYTKTKVNFEQYSNLKIVNNQIDMYSALPIMDCLITDYSSICMDFYFANKPVIFYLFDQKEYVNTSRKIDFDPTIIAPESTATNWEIFMTQLKDVEKLPLLNNQSGKKHFASNIKPNLKELSEIIKHTILNSK